MHFNNILLFPDLQGERVTCADFQGLWKQNARRMIEGANLTEVPPNIHGIRNGTTVQCKKFRSPVVSSNEIAVVFYDGNRIHVGGIDSPAAWTLEEFLQDINDGYWEVVGEV